jgi:hypothetical protein
VETGYQGADPETKKTDLEYFVIKRWFRLVNQLYFSQFVCQSIQHVGLLLPVIFQKFQRTAMQ